MDLFTEHHARYERMVLDHDVARAVADGVKVSDARRAKRPNRWAPARRRLRMLLIAGRPAPRQRAIAATVQHQPGS